jgi:hypothetical protein
MFCHSCGSEERQASQFCRLCGADLRPLPGGPKRPDPVTASAESAREEIGRAVAEKIRQMEDAHTLERFARRVLPQVAKFLESPEEKRLRRLRAGTITALVSVALGAPSLLLFAATGELILLSLFVTALISFATGIALLINGLLLSKPRQQIADRSLQAGSEDLLAASARTAFGSKFEGGPMPRSPATSSLVQPAGSITEHTTLHLKSER